MTIELLLAILGRIAEGAILAISVYLAGKDISPKDDDSRGK